MRFPPRSASTEPSSARAMASHSRSSLIRSLRAKRVNHLVANTLKANTQPTRPCIPLGVIVQAGTPRSPACWVSRRGETHFTAPRPALSQPRHEPAPELLEPARQARRLLVLVFI